MTYPKFQALEPARIRWDENGAPFSEVFDDLYFSRQSGIDETNHVFIRHNRLAERWLERAGGTNDNSFIIGETGFGTGLNFLVAARLWLQADNIKTLHFISAEKHPLAQADLQRAAAAWPGFKKLAAELAKKMPPAVEGIHRLFLAEGKIHLTLLLGDAAEQFANLKAGDHPGFRRTGNSAIDAWFLDGFAPAKNPGMWTDSLFQCIADLSHPGTTFSTFTAAGTVRRRLQQVGFTVKKVPGFGNKRDMLAGVFSASARTLTAAETPQPATPNSRRKFRFQPPWYLPSTNLTSKHPANNPGSKPASAVVIGGGIAGCSTARALAGRGVQVTLLERHNRLAREASGNPQGITYPRLSLRKSPLANFSLRALLHAGRFYQPFWRQGAGFGQQSGVILLPPEQQAGETCAAIARQFPRELVQALSGADLRQAAGVPLAAETGLFFPSAGWVNPPVICGVLARHNKITLVQGEASAIQRNGHWEVADSAGNTVATAEILILACGNNSGNFTATEHLPLKPIRGQISHLPASAASRQLKTVICGKGYLAPATDGIHTLGATYNLHETSPELRPEDNRGNLQQITLTDASLPKLFGDVDPAQMQGRVAFRCTTPDYLPIVGPAPKLADFLNNYALLRSDAKADIPITGSCWPGLYINCGHGSRGMTYAPLCAELLVSSICCEPPPLELGLRKALHPGRFIIRNLKRNTI